MIEEIKYRQVEESDADSIYFIDTTVYENIGKSPLTRFYIKDCIELYRHTFFVALVSEEIVGFCIGIGEVSTVKGWIGALTVKKDFEGKGIGGKLLDFVCVRFYEIGLKSVLLTTEPMLVAFYRKHKFVVMTDLLKEIYGIGQDRFIMEKTF